MSATASCFGRFMQLVVPVSEVVALLGGGDGSLGKTCSWILAPSLLQAHWNVNSLSLTATATSDKAILSDELSFGSHDVVLYSIRYSGASSGKAANTLEAGAGAISSLSRP